MKKNILSNIFNLLKNLKNIIIESVFYLKIKFYIIYIIYFLCILSIIYLFIDLVFFSVNFIKKPKLNKEVYIFSTISKNDPIMEIISSSSNSIDLLNKDLKINFISVTKINDVDKIISHVSKDVSAEFLVITRELNLINQIKTKYNIHQINNKYIKQLEKTLFLKNDKGIIEFLITAENTDNTYKFFIINPLKKNSQNVSIELLLSIVNSYKYIAA